ncbi:unnamed protein product [marine sediment metagenome]|uniref:Gfo/Idh/MocA-like oxidoreductase C-terminal domain-containing protein n=1 Tax=marine sediment metagenome TaxID=412755 RepID=X1RFT7_9ZZZZ
MIREGLKETPLPVDRNNTLQDELSHFLDCVRDNSLSVSDGVVGYHTIELLEAAEKSLKEKRVIMYECTNNG